MSGHSPEAIKKEIRNYIAVFVALAVLTVVTVAVSYLKIPLGAAIALALIIASIKGGLVAAIFMHLRAEKKIVWFVLAFTVLFFFVLLLWPSWHPL